MIRTNRPLLACALALGLTAPVGLVPALAQGAAKPDQGPREVALTQKQIDGLIAAQPELAKVQPGEGDKPDPKAQEKVESIAKANGFVDFDELAAVDESVETVLAGIDPDTKTFVGETALLRKQIAQVEADKAMPETDKAAALKELKAVLAAGDAAKPSDGNVALVTENYDKLSEVLQGSDP